jgi:hypothetical protein
MAELQNGNVTASLRRYSNDRGVISPSVSDDIAPTIQLDEVPWRQDGVAWGPVGNSIAASVGNLSTIGLYNDVPEGDRSCMLITQLLLFGSALNLTIILGWGSNLVAGGTQLQTAEYDRIGTDAVTVNNVVSNIPGRVQGNNGVPGSRIIRLASQISYAANAFVVIPCEIVVPPSTAFYMETTGANVALQGGFAGRYWRQIG